MCGICLCGVHMCGVCAWMCVVVGVCVYIHVCCICAPINIPAILHLDLGTGRTDLFKSHALAIKNLQQALCGLL